MDVYFRQSFGTRIEKSKKVSFENKRLKKEKYNYLHSTTRRDHRSILVNRSINLFQFFTIQIAI